MNQQTLPPPIMVGMPPPDFSNLPLGCCTPLFGMPLPPMMIVYVQGLNGYYLAHNPQKPHHVIQSPNPEKWEISFLPNKPGCITFKNDVTKKFLCAEKILGMTGTVTLDRTQANDWESWNFEFAKPGYFYAKSDHGKFLTFEAHLKVGADTKHVGDAETFCFINPPL